MWKQPRGYMQALTKLSKKELKPEGELKEFT